MRRGFIWEPDTGTGGPNRWIGTAVARELDGRRWVDFAEGDRSAAPFQVEAVGKAPRGGAVPQRRLRGVPGMAPSGPARADRRVVGQGSAVRWNAGLHSVWRGKLRRLMRRTKGDTKSVAMLVYSLGPGLLAGMAKI